MVGSGFNSGELKNTLFVLCDDHIVFRKRKVKVKSVIEMKSVEIKRRSFERFICEDALRKSCRP